MIETKAVYFERERMGTITFARGCRDVVRVTNVTLEQFKKIAQRYGGQMRADDSRLNGYYVR